MIRLNALQYNPIKLDFLPKQNYSLDSLVDNFDFENLCIEYKERFGFSKLKTFSFTKEGFLGLFLELNKIKDQGKIAVSLGETQALIEGAKLYQNLGFEIIWINLKKDGTVNLKELKDKNIDFLFLSSYIMDTFVKTSLEDVKHYTNAKIISNASAEFSSFSDAVYFDNYKLCGYSLSGILLFNDENLFSLLNIAFIDTIAVKCCLEAIKIKEQNQKFNLKVKDKFLKLLKERLKGDIYFFVDNNKTLAFTLHFALKNIKARDLIRTLAFDEIFLSNGEGCSLGLSRPSRVIQAMGYDEPTSRNAICLTRLISNCYTQQPV